MQYNFVVNLALMRGVPTNLLSLIVFFREFAKDISNKYEHLLRNN